MDNPDFPGTKVHQVEMGISLKDSEKPEATRMVIPTANTAEVLDLVCANIKGYIGKYYPQKKL